MALVEQRPAVVSIVAACGAVGLSRATLYRLRRPPAPTPVPSGPRAPSPRRLSDTERQRILDTLHEPGAISSREVREAREARKQQQ